MIINFEEVKFKRPVKGTCSKCGKRKQRIISVCETVNPFNKNGEGFIKTYDEVRQSVSNKLQNKVDELTKEFICSSCE